MSVVMTYGASQPVVKVGRIAGPVCQAAVRPDRKALMAMELPSYRGDIINGIEFDEASRIPDPDRMMKAYRQSAATLNLLRAFAQGRLCQS
jgi:3-deoxy-7-phosphoheptulonate synthase